MKYTAKLAAIAAAESATLYALSDDVLCWEDEDFESMMDRHGLTVEETLDLMKMSITAERLSLRALVEASDEVVKRALADKPGDEIELYYAWEDAWHVASQAAKAALIDSWCDILRAVDSDASIAMDPNADNSIARAVTRGVALTAALRAIRPALEG